LNCSDQTAAMVDEEISAVLKESYEKALSMLRENIDILKKIAAYLIEKETITGKEFMKIFRKEKGLPDPEEETKESENKDASKDVKPEGITIGDGIKDITFGEPETKAEEEKAEAETAEEGAEVKAAEPSEEPKWEAPKSPDDGKNLGRFSGSEM
ncbi:MAG: ATP-dependent metallopeptidase HflB, partial [Lachnospiraceae bacterium]|nr:ATP-dependent metallopeptidase HflB [Lachnospiraceae bacterium]